MKTPIPGAALIDRIVQRVANAERLVAALVDIASPEQLRRAIAANNARASLAALARHVADAALTVTQHVTDATVAVCVSEYRGAECVTPAVVFELPTVAAESQAALVGKSVGDRVDFAHAPGVHAILRNCWDSPSPKRSLGSANRNRRKAPRGK